MKNTDKRITTGFMNDINDINFFSPSESEDNLENNIQTEKKNILNRHSSDIELLNKISLKLNETSNVLKRI